jgi:hypothetical protein
MKNCTTESINTELTRKDMEGLKNYGKILNLYVMDQNRFVNESQKVFFIAQSAQGYLL